MSEEGQLYELTKELVEQITGRYTENIQDPDYHIAWTYLHKALNIRNVIEKNYTQKQVDIIRQISYREGFEDGANEACNDIAQNPHKMI